jgi:hypothetical protein
MLSTFSISVKIKIFPGTFSKKIFGDSGAKAIKSD